MGSKGSSTTTQQVTIPPEVLARYNAVNAQAEQVAATPFQQYSTDPNAFVAPLTSTQQAGIANTNQYAGTAQPYYQAGAGLTLAGAQAANPTQIGGQQIGQYMSPYLSSVVGTTLAAQQMQNQQQQSNLAGQAATAGAFGGDRSGIAQANLAYQQNLANQQTLANQLNTGYNTALATAQQQQGVDLAAQQANLARLTQAGGQLANLGAGAQTAGLTGAQAQLAAGQAQQQTEQAGLSALYNQFLQQQGYPFQTTQFLANIAEGTGALSGSTTTTTQPAPFFSDERLKDDKEIIGKAFDGTPIYKFKYKGDNQTHIGLMAQDVEKKHPEAVGLAAGFKTVDYDKATQDAAKKGHYSSGGGLVGANMDRQGFADGTYVDPSFEQEPDYNVLADLRQYSMHEGEGMARGGYADGGYPSANMFSPYGPWGQFGYGLGQQQQFLNQGNSGGLGATPGRAGYFPSAVLNYGPSHNLMQPMQPPRQQPSGFDQAVATGEKLAKVLDWGSNAKTKLDQWMSPKKPDTTPAAKPDAAPATNSPPATGKQADLTDSDTPAKTLGSANSEHIGSADDVLQKPTDIVSADIPQDTGDLLNVKTGGLIPRKHRSFGGKDDTDPQNQGLGYGLPFATATSYVPPNTDSTDPQQWKEDVSKQKQMEGGNLATGSSGGSNALGDIASIFSLGKAAYSIGSGIASFLSPLLFAARGGSIGRSAHADGGVVGRHGYKLDANVPDDSGTSIVPNLNGVVPSDADIAPTPKDTGVVAPKSEQSFFERYIIPQESSGRQFDTSGEPLTSKKGAIGIAQVMPATAPEAARLAGVPYDPDRLRNDPEYNMRLGKAYFDKLSVDFNDPMLAAAAYNAGPNRVMKAMQMAEQNGGHVNDYLPKETVTYLAHLSNAAEGRFDDEKQARTGSQPKGATGVVMSDASPIGGVAGTQFAEAKLPQQGVVGEQAPVNNQAQPSQQTQPAPTEQQQAKEPSFWDKVPKDSDFWIPLIAGVGGMLSSKSLSLAGAIGDGLVSGATAYQTNQKLQSETNLTNEQAKGVGIENRMKPFLFTPYGRVVFLNDGRVMWLSDYQDHLEHGEKLETIAAPANAQEVADKFAQLYDKNRHAGPVNPDTFLTGPAATTGTSSVSVPPKATPTTTTQTQAPTTAPTVAPKPQYPLGVHFDDKSMQSAKADKNVYFNGGQEADSAQKASDAYTASTKSAGDAARQNNQIINDMAANISKAASKTGVETMGSAFDTRADVVKLLKTAARSMNINSDLSIDDIKTQSDKYKAFLSALQSSAGNNNTLGALINAANTIADPSMPPKAATELAAELWSINQQMSDKENHRLVYFKNANGNVQGADQDFRDHNPQDMYQREKVILQDLMLNHPDTFQKMMSGTTPTKSIVGVLNKYNKVYGGDTTDMLRYFGRTAPNG
jgi:hypothetical protein